MLPFFMSQSPKRSQKSVGEAILDGGGTQKVRTCRFRRDYAAIAQRRRTPQARPR